jgi:hypothetical protein
VDGTSIGTLPIAAPVCPSTSSMRATWSSGCGFAD